MWMFCKILVGVNLILKKIKDNKNSKIFGRIIVHICIVHALAFHYELNV